MDKETKVIQNVAVARALIKRGATVCDIKPSKFNPVATVVVFVVNDVFTTALAEIEKDIEQRKAAKESAGV